jgi:tetratricopeptide (TPR) repeat protein
MAANFLYNLAAIHSHNGNHTEALELDHRALEILRENLGEEHPLYAKSLNTLAVQYQGPGNYTEAESLFQRSIQIIQTTLGKEHDAVTEPQNNLALLYFETGNNAKAEALLQESLMTRRKALGEYHPAVAMNRRIRQWYHYYSGPNMVYGQARSSDLSIGRCKTSATCFKVIPRFMCPVRARWDSPSQCRR